MLAVILSKAMMLAQDTKITDPSILSQCERGRGPTSSLDADTGLPVVRPGDDLRTGAAQSGLALRKRMRRSPARSSGWPVGLVKTRPLTLQSGPAVSRFLVLLQRVDGFGEEGDAESLVFGWPALRISATSRVTFAPMESGRVTSSPGACGRWFS